MHIMKKYKHKINIKIMLLLLAITVSVSTFQGCSKNKNMVLSKDVRAEQLEKKSSNVTVKENIVDLKLKDMFKGSENYFFPRFWCGDDLLGVILNGGQENFTEYPIEGVWKNNFYSLGGEGVLKETGLSVGTDKPAQITNQNKMRDIVWIYSHEQIGTIYYYDFSINKGYVKLIEAAELFKGLPVKGDSDKVVKRGNKIYKYSVADGKYCELVHGNDKYVAAWGVDESTNKGIISLLEIQSKKICRGNILNNIDIKKVVYIKPLESFVAIDKNGECYKLIIKSNRIELKQFSKIDLGDLETIDYNWQITLINDSEIAISNGLKNSKNILIMYNFKNNEVKRIFNTIGNEQIHVEKYYPEQNIVVLSKYKDVNLSLENFNLPNHSVDIDKSVEAIYLAQIINDKLQIFYEIKHDTKADELYDWLHCAINEKGDKLFISKIKFTMKDNKYTKMEEICNLYSITR